MPKLQNFEKLRRPWPRKFWRFLNGTRKCEIKLELDKARDYFSKINHCQETETSDINLNFEPNENEEINIPITLEEIKKAARILKNNKSSGIDMILNEHIKHSLELPHIQQLYLKLFNLVFDTGHIPEAWSIGKIIPVYKQIGGPTDPSNYRPITLLSCMGKLFTAVINNRLQTYSEEHSKINNCQAGFRKKFSTTDHIFALHTLINILQSGRKKLFCGFIDLKQAFDSVWRDGLFYKIKQFDITGKCFRLIKSMYDGIKSCVSVNGVSSNYFYSNIGVRQGENLSPFLFTIFLNDLETFLSESPNCKGIEPEENMYAFFKLFVLLYADDTAILAESSSDLQNALDTYALYCETWKLKINIAKTKVLVFSRRRLPNYEFTMGGDRLEVVSEYKYLGVIFSKGGSFLTMKKHIALQASKAVFSLLKKARSLLPIDIQIEIFSKTIKPILLYGCEIWGFGDLRVLEQVQLKFLKFILNIKKSTPNCIVYGETGMLPLKVDIQSRIIAYWSKLVKPETDNLSSKLYWIAKTSFENRNNTLFFKWFVNIRSIFINCGCSWIWDSHTFLNKAWLKATIKQRLTDLYFKNGEMNVIQTLPVICIEL